VTTILNCTQVHQVNLTMNKSESLSERSTRSGISVQPTHVDVIAHRGGDGQWPGETIFAFTEATKGDADVIEMDIWGTADKPPILVLAHWSNLGKMTEGTQKLPFVTFDEIDGLNAAYRWSPDGGQTFPFRNHEPTLRIAGLREVFEAFGDKRMNIEIKQKRPSIVEPLLDLIEESKVSTANLLIASFHTSVLKQFRAKCKQRNLQIATSASTWEWVKFYFAGYLFRLHYKPPAEVIQMAERLPVLRFWLLTRGLVRRAHQFGLKVHAWTVNDTADMQRAIVSGVDGIVTDFPGRLQAILTETQREQSLLR
jgi:glycerophosphoryl diester phosphodiesterase